MSTINTGKIGEDIAQDYLEKKGYKVVSRNYKNKYGEIDLIMKNENALVFTEVRTKTEEKFGTPEESLDNKKKKKLTQNAKAYVLFKNYIGEYQIDFICVVLNSKKQPKRITHYKNITM